MPDTPNYGITKPTVGGSDDTWGSGVNAAIDDIDSLIKQVADLLQPVGSLVDMAAETNPDTDVYLYCDGSAVSRATYASLFDVIGTAHGEGDGSTTFNLPDYRGKFRRGWDDGAGNDPDAAGRTAAATGGETGDNVGSVQDDAFQGHYHESWYDSRLATDTSANFVADAAAGTVDTQGSGRVQDPITDGSNGTPRTSSETRPKNANVATFIKYTNAVSL